MGGVVISISKHLKNKIRGKKLIGSGVKRLVYKVDSGCVIKIAKSKSGIKSNKIEVKIYKAASHRLKKHLAKILDHGYGYRWLTMKRYKHKVPKSTKYERKLFRMRAHFREKDIIPNDVVTRLGQPNYQNLRLRHNKKIIVIDYGNFIFRR